MTMDVTIPKIQSKYITAFKNESSYDAAYPTFEEVNWSAIKPAVGPEELPDEYRLSRRLSHMYVNGTPPDYKFSSVDEYVPYDAQTEEEKTYADAHQIAHHNTEGCPANQMTPDDIRKAFFLEIVWGYSGWEWHDYERVIGTDPDTEEDITETLKGGNLYKIKEIQTVPHIIDGDRLQHINDFLFSQYNVTRVEGFNTSNLVAANRAFKRGTNDDTTYPKRDSNQILECHFVEGYNTDGTFGNHPFGYADPVTGESLLENLVEADGLFFNNKVYMYEGDFANVIPFTIPNIKNIDSLYSYGVLTDNLKFKIESLEELTNCFRLAIIPRAIVNLNDIFVDNTLNNIKNFSGFLTGASLTGYTESGSDKITTVQLDLTNSNVDSSEVIDLSHFADIIGPSEYAHWHRDIIQNTILNIDLNFNNKVTLENAFNSIARDKYYHPNYIDISVLNNGFEKIHVDFNNKESYITSLKLAFANNTFVENLPIQQVPNNTCDDSFIYQSCIFNAPINYNFLNGSIVSPRTQGYGQFNDCTINDSYTFSNIQGLDRVEFCGIKFGNNVSAANRTFPYVVQNQNDTTYRYFDMCGSKFNSMPSQNIYINSDKFRNSTDKYKGADYIYRANPFLNCSEFTDLSNVHLYYSDVTPDLDIVYQFDFSGCTNLIKTPYIHFNYYKNIWTRLWIDCHNLHNLTTVNFENFNFNSASHEGVNSSVTFKDCENLVYLKIGTADATRKCYMSLDIRGCFNLDTATLGETIHSMDRGEIKIMQSIWSNLNEGDLDTGLYVQYCRTNNIGVNVTEDSSYVPGS